MPRLSAPTAQTADKSLVRKVRIRQFSPVKVTYFSIIVGGLAAIAIAVPNFATLSNLANVLNQSAVLALLAMGLAFVLITGGIDLSLPANMAFTAIIGTMLMRDGVPLPLALLAMMAISVGIGLVNGLSVASLGMIPFLVTLATMTVLGGAAVWITQSVSVTGVPRELTIFFSQRLGPVQLSVLLLVVVVFVATIAADRTAFGRKLYAVGVNPRAASIAALNPRVVIGTTYLIAGLLAGLAAIFTIARLGSASANLGTEQVVLDVVSAAVVGGVSIYGGVGRVYAAALGAVFITAISNATTLMGIEFSTVYIIKGGIIIIFVALDMARRRSEQES